MEMSSDEAIFKISKVIETVFGYQRENLSAESGRKAKKVFEI